MKDDMENRLPEEEEEQTPPEVAELPEEEQTPSEEEQTPSEEAKLPEETEPEETGEAGESAEAESAEVVFTQSVEQLKPDDIPFNPLAVKKSNIVYNAVRYLVLAVCTGTFLYSGYYIVTHIAEYLRSQAEYDQIRDIYQMANTDSETVLRQLSKPRRSYTMYEVLSSEEYDASRYNEDDYEVEIVDNRLSKVLAQLDVLRKMNKDTLGWIYISSSDIDYPVVKSTDNEFYLNHNFNKRYSGAGAIFADYKNSFSIDENRNTVLYGHNMADHSMFYQLLYFKDNIKFFNNSYIELSTPDGIYIFEAFSVYRTDPNPRENFYIETEFESDEAWVAFLNEVKGRSIYYKNVTLNADSRVLTLSTCTNTLDDYRWAVHCVLVDVKRP